MIKQATFKTSKGTDLPLLDLRGKPYLQVAHRLVWFREDHPDWGISTKVTVDFEKQRSLGYCEITDATGRKIASAHKVEDAKGFGDYTEKCETGAVGRALALCGYGTQFAPEIDEADRIVDAPVIPAKPAVPSVSDEIIKIMGRLKNELHINQKEIGAWMKEKSGGMASVDWTMHTVADVNAIIDQELRGK